MIIDATDSGSIASLINHSCKPNCEAISTYTDNIHHVCIHAIRSINVGEELTYDYR